MTATLDDILHRGTVNPTLSRQAVATTVARLADAAVTLSETIREGALGAAFGGYRGTSNAGGDSQCDLDVHADELFIGAAREAPVAVYASEELEAPAILDPGAPLVLAIDPLDGSSSVDVAMTIGTIFAILPKVEGGIEDPLASFLVSGRSQLAAGFFIYGPQLALVLTLGSGTQIFTWSARRRVFILSRDACAIPPKTAEFAVNASNYRQWDEAVRLYMDDCLNGGDGPRAKDFNMRWLASLVADAYRIFVRGGVYLYPGDKRKGYGRGRLRLIYEANPMAMLVEQAGGAATDTATPILDIVPETLHQRVPLVFGAAREVEWIGRYHSDPSGIAPRSPLFGARGLFRA